MKNIIKFSIVALFLVWGAACFAQTLGVTAGLNLSNLILKDDDATYSNDFKMNTGFHVGPTLEFPRNDIFSYKFGLLLSTKGFHESEKGSDEGEPYEYKVDVNLLYLDIPLLAKATFDAGGSKIYGVLGPYIGFGLNGKAKSEYTAEGETEKDEEDIQFGSDEEEDHLKRFDYGAMVGAGIEFNAVELGATYAFGLANLSPSTDNGSTTNHRVIWVSFGYKMGQK